jgi:hypothetical protein
MVFKALTLSVCTLGMAATAHAELPVWQPDDGDVIAFEVFRKGDKFGTHKVIFDRDGDRLTVTTDVDLRVGAGPITFFSYRLDATEVWQGDQLVSVRGKLKEGGDREAVEAEKTGESIRVSGSAFEGEAPASILPSSHWRSEIVTASQMLSTENGALISIKAQPVGSETIEIDGQALNTTRYEIDAEMPYSIWYDEQGRWVKLEFTARGDRIEYRLASLY